MTRSLCGFSRTEAGSGDKGHGGNVTGGDPMAIRSVTGASIKRDDTRVARGNLSVIGTSTDIDNVRGDTGATLGETETGT